AISTIADTGFSYIPLLAELDLRGNTIVGFPKPLYKGLAHLKSVLSDSYKLCLRGRYFNVFLVFAVVAPILKSNGRRTEEIDKVTTGDSGMMCEGERRCLADTTSCVDSSCVCQSYMKGEATIECVGNNQSLCYIAADPDVRLHTFGNAVASVDLPCRYRAARFVTENLAGITTHSACAVEVHVTSQYMHHELVEGSAHVSVSISDPAQQLYLSFHVYMTANVTMGHPGTYYNHARVTKSLNNAMEFDINPTFDEVNNFVVLDIPMCETRVKFRAFDPNPKPHQQQLPGVTIQVPSHAEFIDDAGKHPQSLCGTPQDSSNQLQNRAASLGLTNARTAVIYDILQLRTGQEDNQLWAKCDRAFNLFGMSNDKVADINACSPLLIDKHLAACLRTNSHLPIDVFNDCMEQRQNGGIGVACLRLQRAISLCRSEWSAAQTAANGFSAKITCVGTQTSTWADPTSRSTTTPGQTTITTTPFWWGGDGCKGRHTCMMARDLTTTVVDTTSPAGDTTSPVGDSTSPVSDTTSLVGDTTSPVGDSTSPVGDSTSPVVDTTSPAGDSASLVGDTTSPVGDTTSPVGDTTSLVGDSTSLVGDSTSPVGDSTSPVGDTTSPADFTTSTVMPPWWGGGCKGKMSCTTTVVDTTTRTPKPTTTRRPTTTSWWGCRGRHTCTAGREDATTTFKWPIDVSTTFPWRRTTKRVVTTTVPWPGRVDTTTTTFAWPGHDSTTTFNWPGHDSTTTFNWPGHDSTTTFNWPGHDSTTTFTWPVYGDSTTGSTSFPWRRRQGGKRNRGVLTGGLPGRRHSGLSNPKHQNASDQTQLDGKTQPTGASRDGRQRSRQGQRPHSSSQGRQAVRQPMSGQRGQRLADRLLSGKSLSRSNWPGHDSTTTFNWPGHDFTTTFNWPGHDSTTTFNWPGHDSTTTFKWPGHDSTTTFNWPGHDSTTTFNWPVYGDSTSFPWRRRQGGKRNRGVLTGGLSGRRHSGLSNSKHQKASDQTQLDGKT
ncbi:hypothetical protein BaRGS_00023453, partial [Batillaria attramentaria]